MRRSDLFVAAAVVAGLLVFGTFSYAQDLPRQGVGNHQGQKSVTIVVTMKGEGCLLALTTIVNGNTITFPAEDPRCSVTVSISGPKPLSPSR